MHCDISPLPVGSPSEAQKVPVTNPVRGFLQAAHANWNSRALWERWLPGLLGVLCGGACATTKSSRKLWMSYSLTRIINSLFCLKCSSKASSGGITLAAARPGRLPHSRGLRARAPARSLASKSSSPGQVRARVAPCMQAEAPAFVAHPTWQAAFSGGAPRPYGHESGAAKRKVRTRRSSSLSGRPSKRVACQIHLFHLICLATQLRPTYRSAGFAGGQNCNFFLQVYHFHTKP